MLIGIRHLSCALAVLFLLSGCAAQSAMHYDARMTEQAYAPASSRGVTSASARQAAPPDIQPNTELNQAFKPQIIYNATLGLRVDRVSVVQERAKAVAEEYGGYIGDSSPGTIQIRVPAERFELALDALAALGNVTQRMVKAQEASERVVDLESRLKSLHALRDRLIVMVDKSENIKHALEVQRELAKVIDQIELINGRLRLTKQQIAYATIDLAISPTPADRRLTPGIPVAWVRDLGSVFRESNTIDVTSPRRFADGVTFDLPDGFIQTWKANYVTQAIDANGVRLRVRRHKNFEGGSGKFWEQLITRSLKDEGALTLDPSKPISFERGNPGKVIRGQKIIAGETVRYMIAVGVATDEDYVYTLEAWGVAEHFDVAEDEINQAIATMRCY